MNIKLIACKVLERELSFIREQSDHYIDISFLQQGLHNEPNLLREILQNEIDKVDAIHEINESRENHESHEFLEKRENHENRESHESLENRESYRKNENHENHNSYNMTYDAIVIGYGLCSNGIAGISSKKHKLVVPKAHDCMTLLLGSKEKYREYFHKYGGGIYWYSPGWIDNAPMPSKARYDHLYNDYVVKYGEENAEYLMKIEQSWMTEYSRCAYINWGDMELTRYINYTKDCANFMKWYYEQLEGSSSLLSDLLNGKWDHDRFIVIPPNCKLGPSYDDEIITFYNN